MSAGPELSSRLFRVAAFFLLVVAVTIGVFLVLVAPESRTSAFYLWLSILCAAEFVAFAWYANGIVAAGTGHQATGATRMLVHCLIGAWFIVTLLVSLVLAHSPGYQPAVFDRIGACYAVLTLLFFLTASALYLRDLQTQQEDDERQADRLMLHQYLPDVARLAASVRQSANALPDQAVVIDRILKRLDGLNTDLEYAAPRATGGNSEEQMARIAGRIRDLCDCETEIQGDSPALGIAKVRDCLDRLELLLRERQRDVTKVRSE